MTSRSSWLAFSVAVTLMLPCGSAFAQDEYTRKEAQQRFQEGTALMNEGKYEQGRAKFVQAYATAKVPNVVYNLARAEHLTGRHLEATRHYREYLRFDDRKISIRDREDVHGWLKETVKHIARLEITAPFGAHVFVDGERIGDAPLAEPIDVERGKHSIVAEIGGKRLTAAAETSSGNVTRVHLEDSALPTAGVALTSGNPDPQAGATEQPPVADAVRPPPEPKRSGLTRRETVGIIAIGSSVAVAVAGGLLLSASSSRAEEGRRATESVPTCVGIDSPACSEGADAARSARDLKTVGSITCVAAGALFVGGVTMALWPNKTSKSGQTTTLNVRGAGLDLIHRF